MAQEDHINGNEIAIIGVAIRAPGAANYREFWQNLVNGVESITFFTEEQLRQAGVSETQFQNPNYVPVKGGEIKDKDCFDSDLFGYTPLEAGIMDPQMRLFHECAWSALEDAGVDPEQYNGLIGFYAGAATNYNWGVQVILGGLKRGMDDETFLIQIDKEYLTTRISHKLDLKGPSIVVQSACSTSLVAVHLACQSLLDGECDIALAGGVTVQPEITQGYIGGDEMPFSNDGHCRAFDAASSGAVFSEGAGIVALMPLDDAIAAGASIIAVIKGSAVNNDGSQKAGYTMPSMSGQARAIRAALEVGEVDAATIGYVETHGTGTRIGDPIEIQGLCKGFDTDKKQYCAIGSLKTNIGHLSCAAGVAGLIKAALCLQHRTLVPSLHYVHANPAIDFVNSPFYVNTAVTDWQHQEDCPRRAGVSSFGIGGTNAHIVLEEHVPSVVAKSEIKLQPEYLLVLSANRKDALDEIRQQLVTCLENEQDIELADCAYTLQSGRKALKHRQYLVVSDRDDCLHKLKTINGNTSLVTTKPGSKPIVFVFSGQGSRHLDMGRELYEHEPQFKAELDRCFDAIRDGYGVVIKDALFSSSSHAESDPVDEQLDLIYAGAMKFSFEYALSKYLMAIGIQPEAMIGYSLGEYVAACLAGIMSLEDALRITVARNRVYAEAVAPGAMLVVRLSEEELTPFLNEQGNNEISLAAVNTQRNCTLAGSVGAIKAIKQTLEAKTRQPCLLLKVNRAGHSWMIDQALDQFYEQIKMITLNAPQMPYISCVTGTWVDPQAVVTHKFWLNHLRQTVRFYDGINTLCELPDAIFVQPGMDRSTTGFIRKSTPKKPMVVNLIRHKNDPLGDLEYFQTRLGGLWGQGVTIDWNAYWGSKKPRKIALPTYPFKKTRYAIEADASQLSAGLLAGVMQSPRGLDESVYLPSWERRAAVVATHVGDRDQDDRSGWLIFCCCGLTDALAEHVISKGENVIQVRSATAYLQKSATEYQINPVVAADFIRLLSDIGATDVTIVKIIHGWLSNTLIESSAGLDQIDSGQVMLNSITQDLNHGYFSLINLVKAVGEQHLDQALDLLVLTNNMHDVSGGDLLCPGKATVLGAVNAIAIEYENINCRSIDVDLRTNTPASQARLVQSLINEVNGFSAEPDVAYRGLHRWARTFTRAEPDIMQGHGQLILQECGVYLIVGGLGRIGLVLADYIAQHTQATIILTGRSEFLPRDQWDEIYDDANTIPAVKQRIKQLRDLEKQGVTLIIAQADVASQTQMADLLHTITEQYGPIDGVIHSTLVKDKTMIQLRTRAECEAVLRGKVFGLVNLYSLLDVDSLDFFICCSSLASFLPIVGSAAYISANAFIDAFCTYQQQQSDVPMIAINWTHWEVDDAAMASAQMSAPEGMLSNLINAQEAQQILARFMRTDVPQLVISKQNIFDLRQLLHKHSLSYIGDQAGVADVDAVSRDNISTEYKAPTGSTEIILAGIWADYFGFDKIGVDDSFFEFGGDSLKAIHIIAKIREKLQVKIPIAELFSHPTVGSLATYIEHMETRSETASLLHSLVTPAEIQITVIAIPYAGGSLATFNKLASALKSHSDKLAFIAMEIPGNEYTEESSEKLTIAELAARYVVEIEKQVEGQFLLYGHCGGTVTTLEVARQLNTLSENLVGICLGGLVIADQMLTATDWKIPEIDTENLHDLFARMDGFGGQSRQMPKEEYDFIANNFAKDSILAIEHMQKLMGTPIHEKLPYLYNLVSKDDPMTRGYKRSYKNWERFFKHVELIELKNGGHYFVDTQADVVAGILIDIIGNTLDVNNNIGNA